MLKDARYSTEQHIKRKELTFFSVLSRSIIAWSIWDWSVGSMPIKASDIFSLTFLTALVTPFPRYVPLSPSRNSAASYLRPMIAGYMVLKLLIHYLKYVENISNATLYNTDKGPNGQWDAQSSKLLG